MASPGVDPVKVARPLSPSAGLNFNPFGKAATHPPDYPDNLRGGRTRPPPLDGQGAGLPSDRRLAEGTWAQRRRVINVPRGSGCTPVEIPYTRQRAHIARVHIQTGGIESAATPQSRLLPLFQMPLPPHTHSARPPHPKFYPFKGPAAKNGLFH